MFGETFLQASDEYFPSSVNFGIDIDIGLIQCLHYKHPKCFDRESLRKYMEHMESEKI
jgi:hypothetical protein